MWAPFQSNKNKKYADWCICMYEIDKNAPIEYSPRAQTSEFPTAITDSDMLVNIRLFYTRYLIRIIMKSISKIEIRVGFHVMGMNNEEQFQKKSEFKNIFMWMRLC